MEKTFAAFRLVADGIKCSSTLQTSFQQMKALVDGPDPASIATVSYDAAGSPQYVPMIAGNLILSKYRELFNGKGNVRTSTLSRRTLADLKKKTGFRGIDRVRRQDRSKSVLLDADEASCWSL